MMTFRTMTIAAALALMAGTANAADEWQTYASPFCAADENALRVLPALTHEGASKILEKLEDGSFVIRWNTGTEHVARVDAGDTETCITAYNKAKLSNTN